MAKDVRIIPADGDIQFYNTAASASGKIQQVNDDLVISNAVGDILFGDTNSDVYIGDGISNVDIIFEQDGEIRGEVGSNVTLTLGSTDTTLHLTGSTLALQKDGGNVGIGTTSPGAKLDVSGSVKFQMYGQGDYTGTPAYNLQVDSSGNVIESALGGTVANATTASYAASVNYSDIISAPTLGNAASQNTGSMTVAAADDADTLDGVQGSSYLRSDANDTYTGQLTIDGSIKGSGQQLILSAGESHNYSTGQTDEYVYVNAEQGLMVVTSPDNWATGWAGRDTTIIKGTSITVNGSTVWHAGNDGPTSGLAAQTAASASLGAAVTVVADNTTNGASFITTARNIGGQVVYAHSALSLNPAEGGVTKRGRLAPFSGAELHITANSVTSSFKGDLDGNAASATSTTNATTASLALAVKVIADNTTNSNSYVTTARNVNGQIVYAHSALAFNPAEGGTSQRGRLSANQGTLHITAAEVTASFKGDLDGNASTATTATNADYADIDENNSITNGRIVFVDGSGAGYEKLRANDGKLEYNAVTDAIIVTAITSSLKGNVDGTATSATTATNANNINVDEKNDNVNYQVLFSVANGAGYQRPYIDTDNGHLLYNPSTHTLTAGTFSGNASTATSATSATSASHATTMKVVANDTFSGTYPVLWHAGSTVYGSSWMTVRGSDDTLLVPNILASGDITATSITGSLKGNVDGSATNADNVNIDNNTTITDGRIMFADGSGTGYERPRVHDGGIEYNAATQTLTVSNLTGNASSATSASYAGSVNYSDIIGTPTSDNYVQWHLAGDADTQNITSNKWVHFVGGASITGAGTEADPYLMTITPTASTSASHAEYADDAGLATNSRYVDVNNITTGTGYRMVFADASGTGYEQMYVHDGGIEYNAGTQTLVVSNLSGNASTATSASHAESVKITTGVAASNYNIPFIFGNGELAVDTGGTFAYDNNTQTLNVTNIAGTTSNALSASHAEYADDAGLATNARYVDVNSQTSGTNYRIVFADSAGTGYEQMYVHDNGIEYDPGTGTLRTSGDIVAYNNFSDKELKKNIEVYKGGLNAVMQLNPVTYEWKKGRQGVEVGLIAQEVEEVVPQVVREQQRMDEGIYKTVDYEKLVAVLIDAVQDQQKQIDELKTKLDGLTE